MSVTDDEMRNRFAYHRPSTPAVQKMHQDWRDACGDLAGLANDIMPPSRELSLVLTKIEEAMFWGNAIVARTQGSEGRVDGDDNLDPPAGTGG